MPRDAPFALLLVLVAWGHGREARSSSSRTSCRPPAAECGRKLERRYLGEQICRCGG